MGTTSHLVRVEEEGSRRELGPAPNPPYMAPLLTDSCPLLEVLSMILFFSCLIFCHPHLFIYERLCHLLLSSTFFQCSPYTSCPCWRARATRWGRPWQSSSGTKWRPCISTTWSLTFVRSTESCLQKRKGDSFILDLTKRRGWGESNSTEWSILEEDLLNYFKSNFFNPRCYVVVIFNES